MRLLPLLFLLTLARSAAGQVTGALRTPAGQPVGFATILLLRAVDSVAARTTMTDSPGRYRLEPVAPGRYFLRCSSIGYRVWESPVFQLDGARDMGVVVMVEDKQQLGAVVVQARPRLVEQTIEGTVVHAESSIMTKGSSILEVLERSPGVQVDQHYNTISLNGKSGVSVMINGKTLQLPEDEVINMLASMPADNLDKLELLTTPPARYDASGNAGM
ncbi:MAG TPA: TonB-dependent receptor, partial [Puia sp.]|nr:TonB-dependent receptor [Puia sp.]